MEKTYLHECLKEGVLMRWPNKAMPIKVYIAPFTWYEKSKQVESYHYRKMIMEAMEIWSKATGGLIRFQTVTILQESQIDIKWRRVDRTSLGHCEYMFNDKAMMYSAEISIGISDGLLHAKYNDAGEVRHTIIHEFGHAMGLIGHSDHPDDVMYVPHQYGITEPSPRDLETMKLLYQLPPGFNYKMAGEKYRLKEPFDFHDVIRAMEKADPNAPKTSEKKSSVIKTPEPKKPVFKEKPEILKNQHDILTQMGKFHIATQNILKKDPDDSGSS